MSESICGSLHGMSESSNGGWVHKSAISLILSRRVRNTMITLNLHYSRVKDLGASDDEVDDAAAWVARMARKEKVSGGIRRCVRFLLSIGNLLLVALTDTKTFILLYWDQIAKFGLVNSKFKSPNANLTSIRLHFRWS